MKGPTGVLYVRVAEELIEHIAQRAHDEKRSMAAVAGEMLTHARLCEHKVTITQEI
jgi:hypothetical protein